MISLKVEGMTCGHCESAVEKALGAVPGVDRVARVSRETGQATVEGRPEAQALVTAVEEAGYRAAVIGG